MHKKTLTRKQSKKPTTKPLLASASKSTKRWWAISLAMVLMAVGYFVVRYSSAASGLNAGLVIRYSFDNLTGTTVPNTAPITNPSQNDGHVYNATGPLAVVPSPNGTKALQLTHAENPDGTTNFGSSQEIDIPDGNGSPQADLKLNNFSISSWIRITDTDTAESSWVIAEKDGSYWMNVRNNNDGPGFPASVSNQTDPHLALRCGGIFNGKDTEVASAPNSISVGPNASWTLVTCTYDNAYLTIYINGRQAGQIAASGTTQTSDYDLTVGGTNKTQYPAPWNTSPRHNFLGGDMDEFRLYNRALAPSEVLALYNLN